MCTQYLAGGIERWPLIDLTIFMIRYSMYNTERDDLDPDARFMAATVT